MSRHLRKAAQTRKRCWYPGRVSVAEVLEDLLELGELANVEQDPERRRSLDVVRTHVAHRARGAKVSEAADLLGISQPTVRAWIASDVLKPVPGSKPVRVDLLALADVKRALDLIRDHVDDRQLLVHVMRLLLDRAALEGADVRQGFEDVAAGRVLPLTDDLLDELRATKGKPRSRSKST